MTHPNGVVLAQIIENMASTSAKQADLDFRNSIADRASSEFGQKILPSDDLITSLSHPNLPGTRDACLKAVRHFPTTPDHGRTVDILRSIAVTEIRDSRKARNISSQVKSVLRPLHDIWLQRWAMERIDLKIELVKEASEELRNSKVDSWDAYDSWCLEVLDLFTKVAVVDDSELKAPIRMRGVISATGIRSYVSSWKAVTSDQREVVSDILASEGFTRFGLSTDSGNSVQARLGIVQKSKANVNRFTATGLPTSSLSSGSTDRDNFRPDIANRNNQKSNSSTSRSPVMQNSFSSGFESYQRFRVELSSDAGSKVSGTWATIKGLVNEINRWIPQALKSFELLGPYSQLTISLDYPNGRTDQLTIPFKQASLAANMIVNFLENEQS
jgi:hypothetical protein